MMSYNLKMSIDGLGLGAVQLIDLTGFADGENNPLVNPLRYTMQSGGPVLRYRNPAYLTEGGTGGYDINLGMVIAASAIIYSTPLTTALPSIALAVLLRDASRAAETDEGLRVVIIDAAGTGEADDARPVDEAVLDAIKEMAGNMGGLEVTVLPEDAPADLAALSHYLMQNEYFWDVNVPPQADMTRLFSLDLPDNVITDAQGRIYFRDLLSDGNLSTPDWLQNYEKLSLVLQTDGGYFILLKDGEETADPDESHRVDEAQTDLHDIADIGSFLERAVLVVGDDSGATVTVNFFGDGELLLKQKINVVWLDFGDRDGYPNPDPDPLPVIADNAPIEADGIADAPLLDDDLPLIPDIL